MRNKPILNGIVIAIFITLTFLMSSCENKSQSIRSISNKTIDDLIVKIETICLDYQSEDVILSLKIRNDTLKNDYNFRYLGVLKVKKNLMYWKDTSFQDKNLTLKERMALLCCFTIKNCMENILGCLVLKNLD